MGTSLKPTIAEPLRTMDFVESKNALKIWSKCSLEIRFTSGLYVARYRTALVGVICSVPC